MRLRSAVRLVVPALLTLLVAAGTPLPATAQPVGPPARGADLTATLTAADSVLYDTCAYYSFLVTFTPPAGYDRWELRVQVFDGAGDPSANATVTQADVTGIGHYAVCGSADSGGTWSISGVGETCHEQVTDADFSCLTIEAPPATFVLRLPRTTTELTVSSKHPAFNDRVTFNIRSRSERPDGFLPRASATVVLQGRFRGHWRRVGDRFFTDLKGRLTLRLRFNVHRAKVRAVTLPQYQYRRSTSPVITLVAR